MDSFYRIHNFIKREFDASWLTPSQQSARAELEKSAVLPGSVNLWGSAGSGKTFLAWSLQRFAGYSYFPHLSYFHQAAPSTALSHVIIDNGETHRRVHRETLAALRLRGVQHAVLISRQLIQDYTHHVHLELTDADLSHVRSCLANAGVYTTPTEIRNLWYVINPHLSTLAPGGSHD